MSKQCPPSSSWHGAVVGSSSALPPVLWSDSVGEIVPDELDAGVLWCEVWALSPPPLPKPASASVHHHHHPMPLGACTLFSSPEVPYGAQRAQGFALLTFFCHNSTGRMGIPGSPTPDSVQPLVAKFQPLATAC